MGARIWFEWALLAWKDATRNMVFPVAPKTYWVTYDILIANCTSQKPKEDDISGSDSSSDGGSTWIELS